MLFVLCDFLAAKWGKHGSTAALIAVIPLAPFSYIMFGYLSQKYPLAVISSWTVLAICLCTVALGIFYFGDELTYRQGAGVLLSLLSIALLVG